MITTYCLATAERHFQLNLAMLADIGVVVAGLLILGFGGDLLVRYRHRALSFRVGRPPKLLQIGRWADFEVKSADPL